MHSADGRLMIAHDVTLMNERSRLIDSHGIRPRLLTCDAPSQTLHTIKRLSAASSPRSTAYSWRFARSWFATRLMEC